jgi:glyoxylase-like metal-dependent hydrolase (beta-lactamase superfamily II)
MRWRRMVAFLRGVSSHGGEQAWEDVEAAVRRWRSENFGPGGSSMKIRQAGPIAMLIATLAGCAGNDATTPVFEEFCLRGVFDLGARMQGRTVAAGEWYPTSWCVVSSPATDQVWFAAEGRSNPDVEGTFALRYLPPDRVMLLDAEGSPFLEFLDASVEDEAAAIRRIDPHRLLAMLEASPNWVHAGTGEVQEVQWRKGGAPVAVVLANGLLRSVRTTADLPLRGRVPVVWQWSWSSDAPEGAVVLTVDSLVVLRAHGSRRRLTNEEVDALQGVEGGAPRQVPGGVWPATVDMRVETVAPGVHVVRGVRTGFHHLVVETAAGLVVADAPAGWVELHQVPPRDLVPGLGISGLSERFIALLADRWPGVPIRAVALTHAHDDHAGGARAFAAVGADVYAPAEVAVALEAALNRPEMPEDLLSERERRVHVVGVEGMLRLDDPDRPVELVSLGANPHVSAALGVHVPSAAVFFQSDLLVPAPGATGPGADRAATDCWFARWATGSLPSETVVHNSHGAAWVRVGDLSRYVEHGLCQSSN